MNRIRTNLYDYVSIKPFIYLEPSIHSMAVARLCVLLPYLALLMITKSWASLGIILSCVLAGLCCEGMDMFYSRKTPFKWINCICCGIITGMLLPSTFSPFAAFFITAACALLLRYILGGFADSWVNTSALIVCVCWIIGMKNFPDFALTADIIQSRNPSLALIQNGTFPVLDVDSGMTASLNNSLFSMFNVTVPEGYVSLLLDSQSVIPAFRFNLLTMFVSIILISFNFIKPLIPAVFILVYSLLVRFVSPLLCPQLNGSGDIILALMTSGTLFSAVFLLQWVGTMPVTKGGKAVYGITAGCMAFFMMGMGTSPAGFVFMVLIVNVLSLVIQTVETKKVKKNISQKIMKTVQEVREGRNA